ncbi:CwfJ C-terminus 1-domain-containing protein-like protein [Amylocarpus encephaloides]|uniref:CwfJ C-terminus 1-domain-containing protein-like protein n=1 Tax=Amylocarpus encephaloides TaxID=45428 RepID=A0A9P8C858_9HELO|nr:CwfJ C-terminus 1-domain-containing protein-like protein [Amylocarpus encephaloides]
MSSKVIIIGELNGQLKSVFTKISALHTKNNFSFAIVTGNLFADDNDTVSELLSGNIVIPLPTYFTVGTNPLPPRVIEKIEQDDEICPNLHYLGKRSTTKTSEGIRIVALGGQLHQSIIGGTSNEQYLPFHTVGDAKTLQGAHTADILLTTLWPASIRTGSKIPIPDGLTDVAGQTHIAELCAALKPRYHFSTSPELFFEREAFFFPPTENAPDVRPLTRFISLAAHGNPSKQKALYAFSLQATQDSTAPLPSNATPSPFLRPKKRPALDPEPYSRYSNHDGDRYYKRPRGRRGERPPPPGPGECFFCLSNPTLATHLISSIGDDSYLTIAKGPLTTSQTNAANGIDFPAHALIIPLTHSPTISAITEDDGSMEKTYAEMYKFKESLQSMIAKRSNNKLGAVTYEISKGNGVHFHWQFVPMPAETITSGLVEAGFRVEAENLNYPKFEARDPGLGKTDGDFFRVWIWTPSSDRAPEGSTKCITMPFDYSIRFSLQFGRIVLAKLLSLEKREQWRDCAQTEDDEKRDIASFKAAYKEFDFTE